MKFLALEQQKEKKDLKSVFISPDMFSHHKLEEGLTYFSAFSI
jgi:hypothetical protein